MRPRFLLLLGIVVLLCTSSSVLSEENVDDSEVADLDAEPEVAEEVPVASDPTPDSEPEETVEDEPEPEEIAVDEPEPKEIAEEGGASEETSPIESIKKKISSVTPEQMAKAAGVGLGAWGISLGVGWVANR